MVSTESVPHVALSIGTIVTISLLILVVLGAAAWLLTGGRRQWLAAVLIAAIGAIGVALLLGPSSGRPTRTVVILDARRGGAGAADADLQALLKKLADTGTEQVELIVIDPDAPPRPDLAASTNWTDCRSACAAPQSAGQLWQSAATEPTPAAAVEAAIARVQPVSRGERIMAVVRGGAGRVVVVETDPARWGHWLPLDVEQDYHSARLADVVVDRVRLTPRPAVPVVSIRAPLGLLANEPLGTYPVGLEVVVSAPPLESHVGETAEFTVAGQLDDGKAVLPGKSMTGTIRPGGQVIFHLPLQDFTARNPGAAAVPLTFPPGFVRCQLDVNVTTAAGLLHGTGTAYLPASERRALIVCGAGDGEARLLVDRLLDPDPLPADPVLGAAQAAGAVFGSSRARAAARFEFCGPAAFRTRLIAAASGGGGTPVDNLPFMAVLHEIGTGFWDAEVVGALERAVDRGMTLVVVDPPPLPADSALASRVAKLLPAVSKADERRPNVAPRSADRTPILNLVFDAGRWGAFPETPNIGASSQPQPDALTVQVEVATRLLKHYGDLGLVCGHLVFDSTNRRVSYVPDPRDRIIVRIAPTVRADNAMTDTLFGSAMELRLAALFAGRMKGLIGTSGGGSGASAPSDPTGLLPAPASVAPYPGDDPSFTPNQALVVFTGNVPQPVPPKLALPIGYKIDDGSERSASAVPHDVLGLALGRGITTAVIRLDVPSYEPGLTALVKAWPGSGSNPLSTFLLDPKALLSATLANIDRVLANNACWLDAPQARSRLLATPGDAPFFGHINIEGSGPANPTTAATAIAQRLIAALDPMLVSPRSGMALAATDYGLFVDERIGPGLSVADLTTLSEPGGTLSSAWPQADRHAAPRRFRQLDLTAGFPDAARGTYLAAVDCGLAQTHLPPRLLAVGGRHGEGWVLCLGYSPFELGESWQGAEDRICTPTTRTGADLFGPQRLIDVATFVGRRKPAPGTWPLVRHVRVTDARGGIEVGIDFRPDHVNDIRFWRPELGVGGGSTAPMALDRVNASARLAVFRLEAVDVRRLTGDAAGAIVEPILNGRRDPHARFYLSRPPDMTWPDLSAADSVCALANFLGGTVGLASDLPSLRRPLRPSLLLGLVLAVALLACERSRWRWAGWLARKRRRTESIQRPLRLDATGISADPGGSNSRPQNGRRGLTEYRTPLRAGDRLEHVGRRALPMFVLGIQKIPPVDRRLLPRASRVDLVVHLGASMRAVRNRRGGLSQVRFVAEVAQLLAESFWTAGSGVRVIGVGLKGGPVTHGPYFARGGEGMIARLVREMARRPTAHADAPTKLEPEPGSVVVWVSDFLEGPDVGPLLSWGSGLSDDDGWFAGVHVRVPEERNLIGLGFAGSPAVLVDRTALMPADLDAAAKRHVAALRRKFSRSNLPFASVSAELTASEVYELLDEAGVMDRPR